jgi:probable F420-dependent oxidoreductase
MEFGTSLPNYGYLASVENMKRVAIAADTLGFNSIWAAERLLVPVPPNQSWSQRDPTAFEPMVTLASMGAVTENLHLCTGILILPARNPVLLARMAASLDVLSGGRLELGFGIGWMREEMNVSGVPFGKRGRIADEYIQILRSIWSGKAYEGDQVKVPPHLFKPRPSRDIPIWIGGNSDPALRRVARLGNGWIPMGELPPEDISRSVEKICGFSEDGSARNVACGVGIDGEALEEPGHLMRKLEDYSSAGATQIIARFDEEIPARLGQMERFAEEIMVSFN